MIKRYIAPLVVREYLPFAGWLLLWALTAAAIGHADTARLFAGYLFWRAARSLTFMDCDAAVRRRWTAGPAVLRLCRSRAAVVEMLTLGWEILVVLLIAGGLMLIDQQRAAEIMLLLLVGAPARHLMFLGRRPGPVARYKIAASWTGAGLALLILLLDGGWVAAALALAVREWAGVAAAVWGGRMESPIDTGKVLAPLDWREIAALTGTRSRHRMTYRIGKGLLGLLGPFSGFIARTGRGVGLHRRADRFVPRNPIPIALLTVGTAAAAVLVQVALARPATLIVSATLLRIAAASGSTLLWLRFADTHDLDEDDDDDD